jgi:hypothetical protein
MGIAQARLIILDQMLLESSRKALCIQRVWALRRAVKGALAAEAVRVQGIYQNVGGNLHQSTRGLVPFVNLGAIGVHERLSHVCQNLPYAQ